MSKKKMFDMICIGESLRDIFYMIDEATVSCQINKAKCLLCLEYAEKIPVKQVVKVPAAGNSANAAVSAVRLGLTSSLVSWVGDDAAGHELKQCLADEGVDVELLCTCSKQQTSEATLLSYQSERTQLLFFKPRNYSLNSLADTRCIYYSAMGEKFSAFDRQLVAHLKKHPQIFFTFQPGTTHIRQGLPPMKALIARSQLFILNKEEAQQLLGGDQRPMMNMLEHFHHLGAKRVCITDGQQGAFAFDGTQHWHMPIYPAKALERTGAGDAFAAGFTVAVLNHLPLEDALRWGTANSWSVIQKIGPQKGLLTLEQMEKTLNKFKTIKPEKMKNRHGAGKE